MNAIRPITVNDIQALHEAAEQARDGAEKSFRSFLQLAVALGERLIAKKAEIRKAKGHGHWLTWLSQNTNISERSAQMYMQAAKLSKTQHAAVLSLRQLALLSDKDRHARQQKAVNPLTEPTMTEITWLGRWRDNFVRKIMKTRKKDWNEAMIKDLAATISTLHQIADRIGLEWEGFDHRSVS